MTEAEWASSLNPDPMLEFLDQEASQRKLRLFACACCRRIWTHFENPLCRAAVELAEKLADGEFAFSFEKQDLLSAIETAHIEGYELVKDDATVLAMGPFDAAIHVLELDAECAASRCADSIQGRFDAAGEVLRANECAAQASLLRCIIGNPFRKPLSDRSWQTSTVLALAQQMYDSRDFAPMPILADALEEAGCENEDILNHCRSGGPHVRGCWVVDLLLGKE